jgi:methylenetetrahydrofolate dehydrogenase (NADP+)/methenyltetrahydrofolate cyclohydrolase
MAKILLGKDVADQMTAQLIERLVHLREKGVEPTLAIVRVGEESDAVYYERGALKRAEKIGVRTVVHALPHDVDQDQLKAVIEKVNEDDSVHGCLLFRPLPAHLDEAEICNTLCAKKDVDGISPASMAGVFTGTGRGFAPCTAEATLAMLKHNQIPIKGARATVIGRSLVIGKPVAMMLLAEHATVTICHTRTVDLPAVTRESDLIIACAGKAEMVRGDMVAPGQTIIDVGVNETEDGKFVGDVAFDEVEPLVANISPVPRGVGSVTTTVLMKHVIEAAERSLE